MKTEEEKRGTSTLLASVGRPYRQGTHTNLLASRFRSSGLFLNASDTTVLSHEVDEWMDDPFGINPTPPWGHPGQVAGCQNNSRWAIR
jgi:hypothetical protein